MVVIVDDPLFIVPNPEVIEPEFNAATVVKDEVTTLLAIVVPVSDPAATLVVSVPHSGIPPDDTFNT